MLIPITSPDDGSEVQEWALVELQGRIEPMQETDLQQELRVGTMQLAKTVRWPSGRCCAAHNTSCSPMLVPFTIDPPYTFQSHVGLSTASNCLAVPPTAMVSSVAQNKDTVQLQIGYHILEGKKMALKKPMAILETVKPDREEQCDDSSSGSSIQGSTHCKVRSCARPFTGSRSQLKLNFCKPGPSTAEALGVCSSRIQGWPYCLPLQQTKGGKAGGFLWA
jgi:hypothetical protein